MEWTYWIFYILLFKQKIMKQIIIISIMLSSLTASAWIPETVSGRIPESQLACEILKDTVDNSVPKGMTKVDFILYDAYYQATNLVGFKGVSIQLQSADKRLPVTVAKRSLRDTMTVLLKSQENAVFIATDSAFNMDGDGLSVEGYSPVSSSQIDLKSGHHVIIRFLMNYGMPIEVDKPVIYLYPEDKTAVTVQIDPKGELYFTYPEYKDEWAVEAYPNGSLKIKDRTYNYLFWEGRYNSVHMSAQEMKSGFVVKGEDVLSFFEEVLPKMGLNPTEYNDFIVYWTPKMQENAYNFIHFKFNEAYARDIAGIEVSPKPDAVLRVFMVYKAIENPIEIQAQQIPDFKREGFTVVEWGGAELPKMKIDL